MHLPLKPVKFPHSNSELLKDGREPLKDCREPLK